MNHSNGQATRLSLPPFENGDRLSRMEFERRYEAMRQPCKAELIEGVVYMASPTRFTSHGFPHALLQGWLYNYHAATTGVVLGDNITVRLDLDNEPQPDSTLLILPEYGGQITFSADGYVEHAPELVVEIAASSVSIDLGPKMTVYRRNGVREYIVWRVLDNAIDWFILRDDVYELLLPAAAGLVKSVVFPGLWLNVPAMLNRDTPTVVHTLNQGLATPEHAYFVAALQARHQG